MAPGLASRFAKRLLKITAGGFGCATSRGTGRFLPLRCPWEKVEEISARLALTCHPALVTFHSDESHPAPPRPCGQPNRRRRGGGAPGQCRKGTGGEFA